MTVSIGWSRRWVGFSKQESFITDEGDEAGHRISDFAPRQECKAGLAGDSASPRKNKSPHSTPKHSFS